MSAHLTQSAVHADHGTFLFSTWPLGIRSPPSDRLGEGSRAGSMAWSARRSRTGTKDVSGVIFLRVCCLCWFIVQCTRCWSRRWWRQVSWWFPWSRPWRSFFSVGQVRARAEAFPIRCVFERWHEAFMEDSSCDVFTGWSWVELVLSLEGVQHDAILSWHSKLVFPLASVLRSLPPPWRAQDSPSPPRTSCGCCRS